MSPTLRTVRTSGTARIGRLLVPLAVATTVVAGCGGGQASAGPAPRLGAEVVQLRRDEVLQRVEIAITNRSREQVVVDTLELRVPGFSGGGRLPKGEPLPPGQVVDLPTPYGAVRCPATGEVTVGRPSVVLQVHTASDPAVRRVVARPRDPQGLLHRIATAECLSRRLAREVSLSFGPWRRTGSGDATVLHGTLRVRLTTNGPRDVTQLAGTVIYDFAADGPAPSPLAHLTPERSQAAVPVVVSQARCDGHARGETKQPYAFLVWVGPPGGAQTAVTPAVSDADRAAFRAVCPL